MWRKQSQALFGFHITLGSKNTVNKIGKSVFCIDIVRGFSNIAVKECRNTIAKSGPKMAEILGSV